MSLLWWICAGLSPLRLGVQTALESPPACEPQSNVSIENAVRRRKGFIRTLTLALQERVQGGSR
eukprot:2596434-Alexandrium_andersonii.AAC.1